MNILRNGFKPLFIPHWSTICYERFGSSFDVGSRYQTIRLLYQEYESLRGNRCVWFIYLSVWLSVSSSNVCISTTDMFDDKPNRNGIKLYSISMNWLFLYLLLHLVRRGDVLAAWSGIRPLVTDPNSKDTQSICRNHIVNISESGLVTIAGNWRSTLRFTKHVAYIYIVNAYCLCQSQLYFYVLCYNTIIYALDA